MGRVAHPKRLCRAANKQRGRTAVTIFRFRKEATAPPARARPTWRKALLPAIALSVAGASVALGAPARADETTILRSWANGTCLDSSAAAVYSSNCSGLNSQNWALAVWWSGPPEPGMGNGQHYATIRDAATGLCLAASDQRGLFSTACNGDLDTYWTINEYWDGNHLVDNIQNTEMNACLDANSPGGPPYVNYYCYLGGAQDWKPGF